MKLTAENINSIKQMAEDLKYWKLEGVEITLRYSAEDPQEYMVIKVWDEKKDSYISSRPYIIRGSSSIHPDHKIEPIVEGMELLKKLDALK